MTVNEAMLVTRAQADPHQFDALYDSYVDRIFAYAMRELRDRDTAKEVTAITFEKAMKALPKYEDRGISFGAWLYRIAHNEIQNQRRRAARSRPLFDRFRSKQNVERSVMQREELTAVRVALGELKQRDRDVLRLHYDEELSAAEIAVVLNCSVDNVYVRLHRALKRLRERVNHG